MKRNSTGSMIKSTKITFNNLNTNKQQLLSSFLDEYQIVVSKFIDILWPLDKTPNKLPKEFTSQITSWLSARAVQAAGKQASGIVRGTKTKQKKRIFIYNKLVKQGHFKKARKLKKIIDNAKVTKPSIKSVQAELDSRFVRLDWNNSTSFDGWITLTSLGNKLKLLIPVNKTKHFNKLTSLGTVKPGIRLSKNTATFNFEITPPVKKETGIIVGLDIGVLNIYSLSTGLASVPNIHGHTLDSINKILARKQKGSKAFKRTEALRDNYINWAFNQLNLSNIKTIKIENIKNLRLGKKTSRYLSHFVYPRIFCKINDIATLQGVLVIKVNPTYTSQRCSCCGWTCKRNRKGKRFKCEVCKFMQDSDLNASVNISLDLPEITREERLLHKNKKGFYWNEVGKEPIVPFVLKDQSV